MSINARRHRLCVLSKGALIAVLAGVAGSRFNVPCGRRQNSITLLLIFAICVRSPFIFLVGANTVSRRWSILSQSMLGVVAGNCNSRYDSGTHLGEVLTS